MPDITLYREDIETLREIVSEFRVATKRRFDLYEYIPDNLARLYEDTERINDLLLDRLVQQRHPTRETTS